MDYGCLPRFKHDFLATVEIIRRSGGWEGLHLNSGVAKTILRFFFFFSFEFNLLYRHNQFMGNTASAGRCIYSDGLSRYLIDPKKAHLGVWLLFLSSKKAGAAARQCDASP